MNAHSSRSHAIFTVLLEQRIRPEGEAPVADEKVRNTRNTHRGFLSQYTQGRLCALISCLVLLRSAICNVRRTDTKVRCATNTQRVWRR